MKAENSYHVKRLIECAIKFNEYNHKGGGSQGIDNIEELLFYIKNSIEIPTEAKVKFDEIGFKCFIYGHICGNPGTTEKQSDKLYQDVRLGFIDTCKTYNVLDI